MAIRNPEERVKVSFVVGDQEYPVEVRRSQIIHEAFQKALPEALTVGHRLTFATPDGTELFADNFIADMIDTYATNRIITKATPIEGAERPWRNIGFDHLAITVADRAGARDFFHDVLQMQVMRDDAHQTVLATGHTALFLFDAGTIAPLSDGIPSRWHHLGFVVDDLEAAYAHLRKHRDRILSDLTLLERDERWSLYCFYQNGDVTFMIQLSEIKPESRGMVAPERSNFTELLYDYASRPYGVVFEHEPDSSDPTPPEPETV
jgi:catechol 2,3-dioxygenase-like lactoylglutathione lyase family enzyme